MYIYKTDYVSVVFISVLLGLLLQKNETSAIIYLHDSACWRLDNKLISMSL